MSNSRNCPDCGVGVGQPHIDGCDTETCTSCGVQKIQCDCPDHDKTEARWGNTDDIIADFWYENYCGPLPGHEHSHCLLCSNGIPGGGNNSGVITTPTGAKVWCVCPNGRAIARQTGTKGPN